MILSDVCLDEQAKSRQVTGQLNAAQAHAGAAADPLWADRSKAHVLALLQDRVAQAGVLAKSCRSALVAIHMVMFPLNDQPDGLPSLLEIIKDGEATYRFVHQHLHCHASFVQVHHPEVDVEVVGTLPPM
jgi:hypothetical protein